MASRLIPCGLSRARRGELLVSRLQPQKEAVRGGLRTHGGGPTVKQLEVTTVQCQSGVAGGGSQVPTK